MALKIFLLFAVSVTLAKGQRPQFAGSRPIGYPEVYNRTTTEGLGDRFGEDGATTPRLPLEANGDRDLVDRLSKLPIDKQPFWFINWQALEANRQKPQTYPQRPSSFADFMPSNTNTGTLNSNSGTSNSNTGTPNSNTNISNTTFGIQNLNTEIPNRNSVTLHSTTGNLNTSFGTQNLTTGTPNVKNGTSHILVSSQANSNTQSLSNTSSNSLLQNRFSGQDTDTKIAPSFESPESVYNQVNNKYNNKSFRPRTPIID